MKKFFSFFAFSLILSLASFAQTLRVMTFNINGDYSKHRANNAEWVSRISDIIDISGADLVFLQETPVQSDSDIRGEFLRVLKDSLSEKESAKNWQSFSTYSYIKKGTKFTLNSAILYDSQKITAFNRGRFPLDFSDEDVALKFGNHHNNLQVAHFFFNSDPKKAFRVVNAHVYYGKTVADRKDDAARISKILEKIEEGYPAIVAGDMNLSAKQLRTVLGGGYGYDGGAVIRTTFRNSNADFIKMSNSYDHIIYNNLLYPVSPLKNALSDVEKDSFGPGEIELSGEKFGSGKEFYEKISDHFPVVMEIRFLEEK